MTGLTRSEKWALVALAGVVLAGLGGGMAAWTWGR